ncbi:MAG: pyridoxamine kinase [Clostridiales bacterium]|nr:pyridoxamine kinase [Clostridiales bacterium]
MTKILPRVAALHDVSGYGKCALTVALPVLSACGVEVCPMPTALLSTNTLFEGFTFMDFTPHMDAYLAHWKKLGLKFNSVYSGFLGSEQQIHIMMRLIREFTSGLAIIDPVMGDNGIIIKTYTPGMCKEMVNLVAVADLATPNVTEACLLTGREYCSAELDEEKSRRLCQDIVDLGTKSVVLTGVLRGQKLYNCGMEADNDYFEQEIDLLPYHMHGTGDLFTSVLTGGLMRGYDLRRSVQSAAEFVYDAMEISYDLEDVFERGVGFEQIVYKLGSGIYVK